jgi:DNA primase
LDTVLPLVPRERIDDVRERTNIVEVIKRHVELKRAGTASFMGLCPFHAERTPSFHVHESRQFFHCFGCGEKGDVFSFLTKIEQRSFHEVLRDLARDAGVELPEKSMSPAERQAQAEAESEREQMLRTMEATVAFFEEQLHTDAGASARAYLASRGISDETAVRFRVGYAPAGWDSLQRHLGSKRFSLGIAERLGVVGVNDRGRYDFFRDRVMLPVMDRQKRPVGFSSRLLDPEAKDRKYVNSPDSPLFHKKEQLYGLHAALDPIRRSGLAIVVEGNFDVMSLHQAGFAEAVAPMGTALTAEQVAMLGRVADRVEIVFDGDSAGERAAQKAVALFVEADVDGRIARLPRGVDPDDFVRGSAPDAGPEAFKKLLENARPVVEQFIDDLARATEATIPDRMKALEEAAPVLARVRNQTARELYGARLASTLGLSVQQVWRAIRAAGTATRGGGPAAASRGSNADGTAAATVSAAPEQREPPRDELEALVLIAAKPELRASPEARRVADLLTDPGLRPLCRAALEALSVSPGHFDVAAWLSNGPADVRDAVSRTLMDGRFDGLVDAARTLKTMILRLERARLEAEIALTKTQLEKARQGGDDDAVRAMSLRQMDLIRTKLGLSESATEKKHD